MRLVRQSSSLCMICKGELHSNKTLQMFYSYITVIQFQRNQWTSSLTGCKKGIFMWKLSSNIRSRLRIELTRIKHSTTTEDSFLYRLVMQFKILYLALRMTTETAINIHLCVMRICKHILLSTFHLELNIKDGV